MSLDRLIEKIEKTQNPSVAGLDPKLAYVPEYIKEKCFEKYGETLKGAAKALLEFNKGLIDALYDIVPAVKPQAAYYEMYGPAGVKALYKTQEYARSKGMYVITDGKRNDIGTTMEAYAARSIVLPLRAFFRSSLSDIPEARPRASPISQILFLVPSLSFSRPFPMWLAPLLSLSASFFPTAPSRSIPPTIHSIMIFPPFSGSFPY